MGTGSAGLVDVVTTPDHRRAYERVGAWDDQTLPGRVAHHAASRPDATAVVDEARSVTYGELTADAARLADALRGWDVEAGSVVSIQLPNRYETVVAAVAALSVGAVVNPLLPNYRERELGHVFSTARPVAIFTPAQLRGCDHPALVADVAEATGIEPLNVVVGGEAPGRSVGFDRLLASGDAGAELGDRSAADVSELIFTSGTEAQPKAIMHTEQTTGFSVRTAYEDLSVTPDDVVWMPSPLGHSTGFNYGLRFALHHGLPLVLQDRWDARVAVRLVVEHGCSYTLAATTFLQDLTEAAAAQGARLDSLRLFGSGGAPVPPALVDAAAEQGIDVLRLYGSTEVLVATWNRPWSTAAHKRDTDGTAMSHVELRVVDDDGRPVAEGEPGELEVRGPDTCVGFFADPERTAATFHPSGWVRSGDLVTIDGDGYLTVVGRKKEIIIRGGMNIAPREIEELLTDFPEVDRAAVVGVPDERLGERACACVVLRPGTSLDLDTMSRRLRDTGLAVFKRPEQLEVLKELPATASGKIQKHELVALLTGAGAPASTPVEAAPQTVGDRPRLDTAEPPSAPLPPPPDVPAAPRRKLAPPAPDVPTAPPPPPAQPAPPVSPPVARDRAEVPPESPPPPEPPVEAEVEPTVLVELVAVGDTGRNAAVIRLNRPDALNPIDSDVLAALDAILDDVEADRSVCTALVTGNGRAFSAGGDLKGYQSLQRDRAAFTTFVSELHRVFGRLRALRVPAVALVNGVAVAGGLELVLNCDFALAAESARVGDGHLNFGQMGGGGVLTLLPRAIGRAKAAELLFSGRLLSSAEAVEWGLASRVVPDDELLAAGLAFAAEVAAKSPLAVANAKDVMNTLWAENASVAEGLTVELETDVDYCLESHDAPEGLAAFAEKRPPRFEGR